MREIKRPPRALKTAGSKIWTAAVIGLEAVPIEVEADVSQGLPKFAVVGLPDTAVQEARERVTAAIKNSGLPFPFNRLTVNLAPADIKKEGPAYDLPIAVAILLRGGALKPKRLKNCLFIGELALDGGLRPVQGALSMAMLATEKGYRELYLPSANAEEAALALNRTGNGNREPTKIFPIDNLPQLIDHLTGKPQVEPARPTVAPNYDSDGDRGGADFDFSGIKGQAQAKRALEIAAAGGHNILLSGPPGAGKTLLARSLPGILPPMTWKERLEVTKIYSVSGLTGNGQLIAERPFRSPHHSASGTALIGGGSWPRPGEVSLAHRGVLFLDELPEFGRHVLEHLRQPLEDGFVTVARAQARLRFPARFLLAAARNPCPCGYASDPDSECSCTAQQVSAYQKRISGPLLDRFDLHLEVPKVPPADLMSPAGSETSSSVRDRVQAARERQLQRLAPCKRPIYTNAEMGRELTDRHCRLDSDAQSLLLSAMNRLGLSARGCSRTLKVSRTIADLAGSEAIRTEHLAEALQFRG